MSDYYKNLRSGMSIPLLSVKDIRKLENPVGKAIYKNSVGRPKKPEAEKAKPSDRLICDVCGEKFIRSHRTRHNQNKVHQAYAKMNKKISKVLLDIDDE